VAGPRPAPFLDTHWNAAELSAANGKSFQVLTSFSKKDRMQSGWLLSFTQLPEDQTLRLDCFRRSDVAPQRVRLQRADELQQVESTVFVYRLTAVQPLIELGVADERHRDVA
jgi:phage gp46-like protein